MRYVILLLSVEHPPLAARFNMLGEVEAWATVLHDATTFQSREAADHMRDFATTLGYSASTLSVCAVADAYNKE